MGLADIRKRSTKAYADNVLSKIKSSKKPAPKTKSNSLLDRISEVVEGTKQKLGKFTDDFLLIRTEQELKEYVDKCIENGSFAIDTETTGLDVFTIKIVGVSMYTPGLKPCYIPINHVSYITNVRHDKQLTEEQVARQLQRLVDAETKAIFFNAKFDIRVMKHTLGVTFTPAWCGFIAAKVINELEKEHNLKYLHKIYCGDPMAEHFTFEAMFKGIGFQLIPIDVAYLYAAKDAIMTYELYEWQKHRLDKDDPICQQLGYEKLSYIYNEIELPIIPIIAEMEDTGIYLDIDFAKQLSEKYHQQLDEKLNEIYTEIREKYQDTIDLYKSNHPNTSLENPINIGSPKQLAELLYDVLKQPAKDKRNERGTGEDILEKMDLPLCQMILDYRAITKLLSTYVDKMPQVVNKQTGRIHCSFHQYGADTGRFACIKQGTPILLGDSTYKPIENIRKNDIVYCYDDNGDLHKSKVLWKKKMGTKKCLCIHIELPHKQNFEVVCTYDHQIRTDRGWVQALNLLGTDRIWCVTKLNNSFEPVYGQMTHMTLADKQVVYDIEVEEFHNFIANNICVHNSSDPNMQNIPSKNKEIRKMFRAAPGKYLVGADYSQQEPFLTASIAKDETLIQAIKEGKDVYGTISSVAFNRPYLDCLEKMPPGCDRPPHPEGKEYRSKAKAIVLGVCYGRSSQSIADTLGVPLEVAQGIKDKVFECFPGLQRLEQESEELARKYGYVETFWGRRRHLPDMQLEPYEVTCTDNTYFDPFFDSEELGVVSKFEERKKYYQDKMAKAKFYKERQNLKDKAEAEGLHIHDNTRFITASIRQCVNCVDDKTEILTKQGWKTVYDLQDTDEVYTLNTQTQKGEWNSLLAINKYEGNFNVYEFNHPNFKAVCTPEHRWVIHKNKSGSPMTFCTTEQLTHCGNNWEYAPIVRCVECNTPEAPYEDWWLKLVGWFLTDGSIGQYNAIHIYQNSKVHGHNCQIIESILKEGNVKYSTRNRDGYITWTIAYEVGANIKKLFPQRCLTPQFIVSLSARQCKLILDQMVMADGTTGKGTDYDTSVICGTLQKANMLQMICQMAGISTTVTEVDKIGTQHTSNKLNNVITTKNVYYSVRLLKRNKIHIYKKHINTNMCNFVWCPTTPNGTWLARRGRNTYFTGNSRVQGSAADQSKIAVKLIGTDPLLKELGFKLLILVHDEVIGECPKENIKQVAQRLQEKMLEAAKDLPVPAKCDVAISECWYGEELDLDSL